MSGPPEGTRPKSALPNPPSWLPPTPPPPVVSVPKACASVPTVLHSGMQSTLQQYHSGQPESSAQNGSNSQNLPAACSCQWCSIDFVFCWADDYPSRLSKQTGHMSSEMQAMATAARFYSDARPVCVLARAIVRQFSHVRPPTGGIHTDIAAGMLYDCVRAKDGRWAFRCSTTQPTGLAVWVWPSATE